MVMFIDQGVYGIPEAAILAEVPVRTAFRWFTAQPTKGGTKHVLKASLPERSGRHAITFLDLIDLVVVGRLRELGVSFPTIRRAYEALRTRFGSDHPFGHKQLTTDGRSIFLREVVRPEQSGPHRKRPVSLENVITGQRVFSTLDPYLHKLEFHPGSSLAARWNIATGVVIDPRRAFGKPVVVEGSVPTYILAEAYQANGKSADVVAQRFRCTQDAVKQAVAFEKAVRLRQSA